MKHILGNSPQCWSCASYTEEIEENEKLTGYNTGWCINLESLRIGVNGHIITNPPKHMQERRTSTACKYWIDAESGHTRFEVLTGYKEPYDGTKIDFSEEQQRIL